MKALAMVSVLALVACAPMTPQQAGAWQGLNDSLGESSMQMQGVANQWQHNADLAGEAAHNVYIQPVPPPSSWNFTGGTLGCFYNCR